MHKLKGFIHPKTPPGTIATIGYSKNLRKKVIRDEKGERDNAIFTRPCLGHLPDGPSLPVALLSPSQVARSDAPVEWGRVCILCWTVLEKHSFRHESKYYGQIVHVVKSGWTSAVSLGNGYKNILPTKHKSKTASQSLYVNPCGVHPKLRIAVTIFSYRDDVAPSPPGWYSTKRVMACLICWTYDREVNTEMTPLPVDEVA